MRLVQFISDAGAYKDKANVWASRVSIISAMRMRRGTH
jgi:hypothetical protein